MRTKKTNIGPLVKRISVDEILEDGLIRLLICELKNGVKIFFDGENDWGEEKELIVNKDDYIQKLDILRLKEKNLLWSGLEEGKVYLAGQFRNKKPDKFEVKSGRLRVLFFDKMIKDEIKQLYFNALEGGKKNAKTNK